MPYKTGTWGEKAKERSRKRNAYFLEYRRARRLQANARGRVAVAVAKGVIKKAPCRDCGNLKVDGHHPDYAKPLDVIWLCPFHHRDEHRRMKKGE